MTKNNLFGFDYTETTIPNGDGSPSRFSYVSGKDGRIVHSKKASYKMIPTQSLSTIADTFIDNGMQVSPFIKSDGEVIGLNINLGEKMTKVGDKSYRAIITVPNNGGGMGYLSIHEVRLVCTNGMTRSDSKKEGSVKIPHNMTYEIALRIMGESIQSFKQIISQIEQKDEDLDAIEVSDEEAAMYQLTKWFYENEMPESHKDNAKSLKEFRRVLFEAPSAIKSIARWNELRKAYYSELEHNKTLGLKLSMYTIFASCTNYLSRRIEASKSEAPVEIMYERASSKLKQFELVA